MKALHSVLLDEPKDQFGNKLFLSYKVEGKSILKNPPQDLNTKYEKKELESELMQLMRRYGIHKISEVQVRIKQTKLH